MRSIRPLKFIAALVSVVVVSSLLSVAVTSKNFSESYPVVVCPPTLDGLGSQISLSSKKTPFQRLQNRSTKTTQVEVLRLPVNKDSLVITSEGVAPVVWQSRSGSWAGGALCVGPASSQWFVGGAADVTTRGRLIIVNSGCSEFYRKWKATSKSYKRLFKELHRHANRFFSPRRQDLDCARCATIWSN